MGANLRLVITHCFHLAANAKYAISDGSETTPSGTAGVEFTF